MYLQWDQRFSLGIREIDDHHQELLAKINELRKALMAGESSIETGKIIDFLEDYAVSHFDEEESIMKKFRYPFYQEHKQAHLVFLRELTELKCRIRAPDTKGRIAPYLAVELERRMSDWFLYHIGNRDRKLADFLAGRL
jgi:hemerythrin